MMYNGRKLVETMHLSLHQIYFNNKRYPGMFKISNASKLKQKQFYLLLNNNKFTTSLYPSFNLLNSAVKNLWTLKAGEVSNYQNIRLNLNHQILI